MPIKRSRSGWIRYLSNTLSEIRVDTIKINTLLTKAKKSVRLLCLRYKIHLDQLWNGL